MVLYLNTYILLINDTLISSKFQSLCQNIYILNSEIEYFLLSHYINKFFVIEFIYN